MVPDFTAVDAAAAAAKASMRSVGDADAADIVETKPAPKEVLLRASQAKNQSGETSEIRKSFQMLRQEWESEKWIPLHVIRSLPLDIVFLFLSRMLCDTLVIDLID